MHVITALICVAIGLSLGPSLARLTVRIPVISGGGVVAYFSVPSVSWGRRVTVTGLCGGALGAAGLALGTDWALPAFLWLSAAGVALAVIDIEHQRLPNYLVFPTYGAGLLLLGFAALAQGEFSSYARALLAMSLVYLAFFLAISASPRSLGFGDVKLAGALGLYLGWLGWPHVIIGLLLGFLVGGCMVLPLLLLRRINLQTGFPFGPALVLGALVTVVAGQHLLDFYLTGIGLQRFGD